MTEEDDRGLKVGFRVLVKGRHPGLLAFIGRTHFADGVWAGIELDKPVGRNNGCVDGKRYFQCKPGHGLFIVPSMVEKLGGAGDSDMPLEEETAAVAIQKLFRGHKAREEEDMRSARHTFDVLEAMDEHVSLQATQKCSTLQELLEMHKKKHGRKAKLVTLDQIDVNDLTIEDTYTGAHLPRVLKLENVLEMIESIKNRVRLHSKYCCQILIDLKKILQAIPSAIEDVSAPTEQLTVVGDLHGQFEDLLTIFHLNGLPSPTNEYIFNGDFVDRGENGVEVCLVIFAFKVLYPHHVHLNRGNHEAVDMNKSPGCGGFDKEVRLKYTAPMFKMFTEVFEWLPLGSLIAGHVLVLHGGLFTRDGVLMEQIRNIKRVRQPPTSGLMHDILWNDPRATMGRGPNPRGPGVITFGPDVTRRFCADNNISLIVRSHECKMDGFEWQPGSRDKLVTVFSASNYCGYQGNCGAIICFGPDMQPVCKQYMATPIDELPPTTAVLQEVEDENVDRIVQLIWTKRMELFNAFRKLDAQNDGCLLRLLWAEVLRNVIHPDIPWLRLQPQLSDLEDDGSINYIKFLERYRVTAEEDTFQWQDEVQKHIMRQIFRLRMSLKDAFEAIDTSKDGLISYDEFGDVLRKMEIDLPDKQLYELMRSIDSNMDNQIDLNEFLDRFSVVYSNVVDEDSGEAPPAGGGAKDSKAPRKSVSSDIVAGLNRIGNTIFSEGVDMERTFKNFDADSSGTISYDEFYLAIKTLNLGYTREFIEDIARAIDANGDGEVDYQEFTDAFRIVDTKAATEGGDWQQAIIQQVCDVFFENRVELMHAFNMFDTDGSGYITTEELKAGLEALNLSTGESLSDMQIEQLMKSIDKNGDGMIDYEEFMSCFKAVNGRERARVVYAKLHPLQAEGEYHVSKRLTYIGRESGNDMRLQDDSVSGQHAILLRHDKNNQFSLFDTGSKNGTGVNGKKIRKETMLKHGDVISIGCAEFKLEVLKVQERRRSSAYSGAAAAAAAAASAY